MHESSSDLPKAMLNYFRMWNERNTDLIREHLELAVSEDCLWIDPLNAHVGREALEENVKGFRAKYPAATLAVVSNVDGHHQRYRYEWTITNGDRLILRGFDVTTLNDDGKIERVDGFFGVLERFE